MLKLMALTFVTVMTLAGTAVQPAFAATDSGGNCIAPQPNSTGTLPQIPRNFVFVPNLGWIDPNSGQGRQAYAEYQGCQATRAAAEQRGAQEAQRERERQLTLPVDSQGNCIPPQPNSTGTLPQIPRNFVFVQNLGWIDPNSEGGRRAYAAYRECQAGRAAVEQRGAQQAQRERERQPIQVTDSQGNCIAPQPNSTGTLPQVPRNFVFVQNLGWIDPNSEPGRRAFIAYRDCQAGRAAAEQRAAAEAQRNQQGRGYDQGRGNGNSDYRR